MAVYTTPTETHEHYIERDTGSGAGVWAIVAVLIVLFALLFFGTRIFGTRSGNTGASNTGTSGSSNNGSINGSVQTPNGSGSGSINY